ncbi:MAG TPA: 2-C-methyl-D-erythritol 4-phosphate cytidylyltransferase [Tetrasphaera sp.]|nr:2-C-methyl-D-erythritol 4-phosphate cytidylyltransferase [Tetrasphaera sp.]
MSPTPDAGPAHGRVGVVVVAAGSGARLGAGQPKAFVAIGGRRILDWAVAGACAVGDVAQVVLVVPGDYVAELTSTYAVSPAPGRAVVRVVAGGAHRSDSVRAGLATLDPRLDIVLVHDAARCLTPTGVYERVIAGVAAGDPAVVPGLPVVDTMKVVDPQGRVLHTPDRSSLRAIQTPQGFRRAALEQAHARGLDASDDAALAESCGIPVRVVDGDPRAFKVTTPADLQRAEHQIAGEAT